MKPISPEARRVDKMAEIKDILDTLIERTDQGKVPWKPTAAAGVFTAALGSYSVIIEGPGSPHAGLRVLNNAGDEIDRLANLAITGRSWQSKLSELYEKARRAALNVDSQLDELLKELESAD